MGHSRFKTNEHALIKLFGKVVEFFVVDDNFPIIKDGMLGFPALAKFKFELSNQQLKLDRMTVPGLTCSKQSSPTHGEGHIER
jgi:hypothetical protein